MLLSPSSQQRLVHVIEPILNPTLKKSHIVLMIDMVATGQGKILEGQGISLHCQGKFMALKEIREK